jgi:hypothetical protein
MLRKNSPWNTTTPKGHNKCNNDYKSYNVTMYVNSNDCFNADMISSTLFTSVYIDGRIRFCEE